MTTTRERREEYHSNVVRTLTPSGHLSPGTHTTEFDSNLDNLLEDLQASVSRPGSSLGQPLAGGYSTTTREVQYLQPANATTVVRERSVSPSFQTNERKLYKTAKYEYKSSSTSGSGGGTGAGGAPTAGTEGVSEVYQRNINQLDTLLNDLERERDSSLDRSQRSLHRVDSGLNEPGTKIIKTTTTYSSAGGKQPVSRELLFDSPGSYEVRQSRSRQRSPSYENASTAVKNVSYSSDSSGIYGGINRSRTVTPVRSEQYYTETRTVSPNSDHVPRNVHYNETVSVDTAPAAKALANIPLSEGILPRPNTKVTTTVRTYTYELPPDSEQNQTLSYRNESFNQTANTLPVAYPERDLSPTHHVNPSSKTILVKNETINTSNNVQEYPVPTILDHQLPPNTAKTIYYKKDTKQSTTNYYPEYPSEPGPHPTNFKAIGAPPVGDQPPYPPGPNTYIYREERTNTANNRYGSPVPYGDYPDRNGTYPDRNGTYPDRNGTYPRDSQPTTVTYKYSSTTSNATRNIYPPPSEREPLLQPFPTDGIPQSEIDGNPPKRVEDLMATLGENGQITYMSKHTHHTENGTGPKKHQEPSPPKVTVVEEPMDSKNALISSKNVAGPPVYYPPGHEMFAKKESEAAAWRAQGEYAKASGKYMYEAESKSKTTSKSGAAVVPVCLPLCCALPCSIM